MRKGIVEILYKAKKLLQKEGQIKLRLPRSQNRIIQFFVLEAKRKGVTAQSLGHALFVLGKSRKEALNVFYNRFRHEQDMREEMARRNAESAVKAQYDIYRRPK